MSKEQAEGNGQPALFRVTGPEYTSVLSGPTLSWKWVEIRVLPPFVFGKFGLVERYRLREEMVALTAPVPGNARNAI